MKRPGQYLDPKFGKHIKAIVEGSTVISDQRVETREKIGQQDLHVD